MQAIFGITIAFYICAVSVLTPIFVGMMAMAARDCRLLSGEHCVWVIVPVSEAPEDQRPPETPHDQ